MYRKSDDAQYTAPQCPQTPSQVSGEQFEVENILKYDKELGFLVQWAGHKDHENTWENEKQLRKEIPELIDIYMRSHTETANRMANEGLSLHLSVSHTTHAYTHTHTHTYRDREP
jgi:hypothetical protein